MSAPSALINATVDAAQFERLRDVRAQDPASVAQAVKNRQRRPIQQGDGRLLIIAADHSARGALGVRQDQMAMADRYDLLTRLAIALSRPGVDGILGTPDIIEDLAILGLLENKIIAGSMNRGGIKGAAFEMDDRYTGYDIDSICEGNLDFAKTLVRINLADPSSVKTIAATADAVTAAAKANVPIMLEPFISEWKDGKIVNDLRPDSVITSIAIAAGLGASSAYTWMKLPVVAQMERVMMSTTLPTLLLGGDPTSSPDETYANWQSALLLPGVRGLVVGRALLYPPDGDVAAAVDTAAALVHGQN